MLRRRASERERDGPLMQLRKLFISLQYTALLFTLTKMREIHSLNSPFDVSSKGKCTTSIVRCRTLTLLPCTVIRWIEAGTDGWIDRSMYEQENPFRHFVPYFSLRPATPAAHLLEYTFTCIARVPRSLARSSKLSSSAASKRASGWRSRVKGSSRPAGHARPGVGHFNTECGLRSFVPSIESWRH